MDQNYQVRAVTGDDLDQVLALYRQVAAAGGGLARNEQEIDAYYIHDCFNRSQAGGIQLLVTTVEGKNVIAEIHCYPIGPSSFAHVLSSLTIAVHPACQGQGVGYLLFSSLLRQIEQHRKDVLRVELITQASNTAARRLYQKLGFVEEGVLVNRILTSSGTLDDDIPMAWLNPFYQAGAPELPPNKRI